MTGKQLAVFMVGLFLAMGGTVYTVLFGIAWYIVALQVLGATLLGGLAATMLARTKTEDER